MKVPNKLAFLTAAGLLLAATAATVAIALNAFTADALPLEGQDVKLVWTDAGNEDKYIIRRDKGNDGSYEKIGEVGRNVLTYTDKNAIQGLNKYKIVAKNSRNSKAAFAEYDFTPQDPSPTPSPDPSPDPSPTPDPTCDASVSGGSSIQAAVDGAPTGARICLSGTFSVANPIRPKDGQTFVGPATLVGAGTDGFDMSTNDSDDVTLIDLDMSGFDDAVSCWEGTQVFGGRLHHNDGNGVGCGLQYVSGRTVLIDGVEIDHNGDPADLGVGAGGIKIARLGFGNFTLRNSYIHDNLGNGVWCDVQCVGTYLIENNVIVRQGRKGVHYEKSGASDEYAGVGQVCLGCGLPVVEGQAIIRFNEVRDNGQEGRQFAADAGITSVSSRNVFVYENVTSGTPRGGIRMVQDDRVTGEKHGWTMEALVENNQAADGVFGCDLPQVDCVGNTG